MLSIGISPAGAKRRFFYRYFPPPGVPSPPPPIIHEIRPASFAKTTGNEIKKKWLLISAAQKDSACSMNVECLLRSVLPFIFYLLFFFCFFSYNNIHVYNTRALIEYSPDGTGRPANQPPPTQNPRTLYVILHCNYNINFNIDTLYIILYCLSFHAHTLVHAEYIYSPYIHDKYISSIYSYLLFIYNY